MINKTHSKRDLIKINTTFECGITNPNRFRKCELSKLLYEKIWQLDYIEPNEEFCFANLIDLKYYLMNINPKKLLTIKQKNELILDCKKIKHYTLNNYDLSLTTFKDMKELYDLAQKCSMFGDIPSVRKMCRDLNKDPYKLFDLIPNISKPVIKELELKSKLKTKGIKCLTIKHGTFTLSFS